MSKQDDHSATGELLADLVKGCIYDRERKMRFYDLVKEKAEHLLMALSEESFLAGASGREAFSSEMLNRYRAMIQDLGIILALIAFWGEPEQHKRIMNLTFSIPLESLSTGDSESVPPKHWYPICMLFYLAGVSAIANKNYKMLALLFHAPTHHWDLGPQMRRRKTLLEVIGEGTGSLERVDKFYDEMGWRKYSGEKSRNKHFYEVLPPILHAAGIVLPDSEGGFECFFKRFEMFQEIGHYQITQNLGKDPILFAGRYSDHRGIRNLFSRLNNEVKNDGEIWPPLRSGLFGGGAGDVIRAISDLAAMSRHRF